MRLYERYAQKNKFDVQEIFGEGLYFVFQVVNPFQTCL